MDAYNKLHDMCYENARKVYGRLLPAHVKTRLEEELAYIQKNDWAQAFLDAAQFMAGDYFTNDDRFNKGFRGPLGASFVAYVCRITAMNPLEAVGQPNMTLYSRMFYERDKLKFYINLPSRIIKTIEERGIEVPDCMCLLSSKNLTLLDELQRATGEKYCCRLGTDLGNMLPGFFKLFLYDDEYDESGHPISGKELAEYIPDFELGGDMLIEVLWHLSEYTRLPRTISEIARILGLLHGDGTWIENAEDIYPECYHLGLEVDEFLCTCAEDVYEILRGRDISEKDAMEITMNVSKGNRQLQTEDVYFMLHSGCDRIFTESVKKINYLFYRAQCLQYAWETARIIYYALYYKNLYIKCLERVKESEHESN